MGDRTLIIDYCDTEIDFSQTIATIKALFNLKTDCIACKVHKETSYSHATYYESTDDLYEWLNDLVQCEDCKNGCQIYKDPEIGFYYCITGSCYYDRETDKYKGTDEVWVQFKDFNWENL